MLVLLISHLRCGRTVSINSAIILKSVEEYDVDFDLFRIFSSLASLLIVIGAGIYQIILGRVENFAEPFETSTYDKLPSAFYAGLFPYAGW